MRCNAYKRYKQDAVGLRQPHSISDSFYSLRLLYQVIQGSQEQYSVVDAMLQNGRIQRVSNRQALKKPCVPRTLTLDLLDLSKLDQHGAKVDKVH
jgi:hypothetical protein